ncbi:sulfite oxidase [Rapidithrix thailandica]|uniref:Sulfite oxidase n=1 Tax=Rapidithrix thailandica TaxID=413964 RepID=A0AAW9SB77_9BACT
MKKENSENKGFNRRKFLAATALSGAGTLMGLNVVFANKLPKGTEPLALGNFAGKVPEGKHPELVILNDRPWNMETPPHLLDDKVTPADLLFVRNNGHPPSKIDEENWTLTIAGESVEKEVTLSLKDLKTKFKHYTYQLTIECGGNGRSEMNPPAKGNQWSTGAVGSPEWTGVRLKDVLEYVGIKSNAVYIGYYGKDVHLSGDSKKTVISRGVPIQKALEEESLIAWAINGQDLPVLHGYPLRLVFGGWPASTSGKWLDKIVVRDKVHDGPKMGGDSYRVPRIPVEPGTVVKEEDMKIIESMPVKSLITYPKSGAVLKQKRTMEVRGHAWAGDLNVNKMEVSIDFGATWQVCELAQPKNRLAWQHWKAEVEFPEEGYYEVWAKATDSEGKAQPMVVPGWNPKGYLNNACHRIAVKVLA